MAGLAAGPDAIVHVDDRPTHPRGRLALQHHHVLWSKPSQLLEYIPHLACIAFGKAKALFILGAKVMTHEHRVALRLCTRDGRQRSHCHDEKQDTLRAPHGAEP